MHMNILLVQLLTESLELLLLLYQLILKVLDGLLQLVAFKELLANFFCSLAMSSLFCCIRVAMN